MSYCPKDGDVVVICRYRCKTLNRAERRFRKTWPLGMVWEVPSNTLKGLPYENWDVDVRPATPAEEVAWRLGGAHAGT